ncbi:hypothetical protein VCR5J5_790066 [Vibrio crassostreae]|uniref:Uncharacterized protein n=1 Tax=Vibrio crassostreae TaxID=246167 RepID=A0A822N8Y1_9VIBR|nr:hypothetical protein VCRA2120E126_290048 [Vibrio crassostreae]CDT69166.1 hypothetical protein VCR5J5_790066 [Vibrio crassostreae]
MVTRVLRTLTIRSHWAYHLKFQIRPIEGRRQGQNRITLSSSGAGFIDSDFYLGYRDIEKFWGNVRLVFKSTERIARIDKRAVKFPRT